MVNPFLGIGFLLKFYHVALPYGSGSIFQPLGPTEFSTVFYIVAMYPQLGGCVNLSLHALLLRHPALSAHVG